MSAHYNVLGAVGSCSTPVVGRPEPIVHPQNCKHECAYGYNKAFCFPCYAKIMNEHRAAKNKAKEV